jgi:hypothetical protein
MTNDSVNESGDTDSCNASDDPHHNIAAAITVLSEKYEASQQDSGEHDRQTLRWTQRATIGVGIYTVLTLVAVVLTYCSLRNAQEQSAITAAQLAMATNSERAYIFLTDLQIDSESAILAPPQISAVWRNYGKTPGILIDAFYRLKTFRIGELYDHTTLASLSIGPTQGVVVCRACSAAWRCKSS